MNIVVFDTETISIQKPFCYNIGYVIYDTENKTVLKERDFVIEQIWHNTELFSTAYYAEKRPIYVKAMRAKKTVMDKFGYVCRKMTKDFKDFDVQFAYAYNSPFDDRVFSFNCDWYKCINPFDNIPIIDIRGHVHKVIAFTTQFQNFCDKHSLYTDTGNYSTSAENVFRYITNTIDFVEEHTALSDSQIELQILQYTIDSGLCEYDKNYTVYNSIPRKILNELEIHFDNGKVHKYKYYKKTVRDGGKKIYLK